MLTEDELTKEDLERIAKAVIEERLDSMKFTIKIDMARGGRVGKRGVAMKRTPEQWKEFWRPRIFNAIGMMRYRDTGDPAVKSYLPTEARIRSYINVPTRLKDEELFDLFSLFMDELVQEGILSFQRLDTETPFYDFTPSSGVDRNQWTSPERLAELDEQEQEMIRRALEKKRAREQQR